MRKEKIGAVMGSAMLVMSLLGGCGAPSDSAAVQDNAPAVQTIPDPTNAAELYERYMANENHDNYHMSMTFDMGMTMVGEEIKTTMVEEVDTAGNGAHGTIKALANDETTETELYVAEEDGSYAAYVKEPETDTWMRQEYGYASPTDVDSLFGDEGKYADAEFEKTDDGYLVTISGLGAEELSSQLGSLDSLGTDVADAVQDAFKNTTMVVEYDKDCLPRKASFGVNIPLEDTSVGSLISNIAYDMTMKMDSYGTIDPESVALPESIKKSAVVSDATTEPQLPLSENDKGVASDGKDN